MKIKMLRDKICAGNPVKTGDIVDAPDKDGRYLVNTGAAVIYVAKKEPAKKKAPKNKAISTDELETR